MLEMRSEYEQRHGKVILQHDNAWIHIVKPFKTSLERLERETVPHLTHYPNIAPLEYYLFRSKRHGSASQQVYKYEGISYWLNS